MTRVPVGGTLNMPTGASYAGFQFFLMVGAIHHKRTGGAGGFPCPVSMFRSKT